MITTWAGLAAVGWAAGKPGALDPTFDLRLRARAVPSAVTLDPAGRVWVSGGFDRANGTSVGDLLVIGPDGGVEGEPLPGYLRSGWDGAVRFDPWPQTGREVFPLADGTCLIPGGFDGWWRADAAGNLSGKAFADLVAGESVAPQFEKDGRIFVIRRSGDGRRVLEARESGDTSVIADFVMADEIPADPLGVVPAADGKLWVLGAAPAADPPGIFPNPFGTALDHSLFRLEPSGALDAGFPTKPLSSFRSHALVSAGDGSVRVVMGPDSSRWNYWPAPESSVHRIEWYDPAGTLTRRQDFGVPLGTRFTWAESTEGKVVAPGPTGDLVAWRADGTVDPDFRSPRTVSSALSLPGGKWLIDGSRRLLGNGDADPAWRDPRLERPASIRDLQPMPGGRMLVLGDFATVDGVAIAGLAVLRADGSADRGFAPDPRIAGIRSAAVQGGAVYVVTAPAIEISGTFRTNLARLNRDGSVDETFEADGGWGGSGMILPRLAMLDATAVHATAGGKILVERATFGGDVATRQVIRLNADGTRDPGFAGWSAYNNWSKLLALKNGGVVIGDQWLAKDGSLTRDLAADGTYLRPLCEWRGGILFAESEDGNTGRLKLWKGKSWVRGFQVASVGMADLLATPGEGGTLYVQARFSGSRPMLRRLLLNGRADPAFRSPLIEYRARGEGEWWQLEDSGPVGYQPGGDELESRVETLRFSRNGGLWVGGSFNRIDGRARDGLARITGGSGVPRRR
jgi:hypothetical protein